MVQIQHLFAKYGKRVLLPGAITVIILLYFFANQEESTSFDLISEVSSETPVFEDTNPAIEMETAAAVPQTIYVDVKGAVHYPGVYPFTTEQRITDAIQQAGGYTEEANPQLINHAQKLQDEMVVYIPKVGEEVPETIMVQANTTSPTASSEGKVNINAADESQLTTLPGIGPAKAAAIIAHRQEKGSFTTTEDLKKVTGIGEKTFEKLQDLIDIK